MSRNSKDAIKCMAYYFGLVLVGAMHISEKSYGKASFFFGAAILMLIPLIGISIAVAKQHESQEKP